MKFDPRKVTKETVGKFLELWTPNLTGEEEFNKWVELTKRRNLRSFIVNPQWVSKVKEALAGTDIKIGTNIDYPWGIVPPEVKEKEIEWVIAEGATTIDMVMNYRALNTGKIDWVEKELKIFKDLASRNGVETKIIIEICNLASKEKVVEACKLLSDNGIDWLKTSSGLWAGPSMEDVELILDNLKGPKLKLSGVKAPRAQNSYAFLMAGAEIIGTQGIEEVIEGLDTLRRVGVLPEYEG